MKQRTELKTEFFGISAINSFIPNISSSRGVMDSHHFSQRPPLLTPDEPIIKSGIEYELGKTIDHSVAHEDCIVKAIIPRYRSHGYEPPEVTLLVEFERAGTLYIDIIHVPAYRCNHGTFGFKTKYTSALEELQFNSHLSKGTILAKADSYGEEGVYMYGLNANVALMSHPSVAEDGYVVSESFVKRASMQGMTKRVININKNTIPINMYGDEDTFKFIPDIGEFVQGDGLLCAIRERNDWFSISDMNSRNLRQVDPTFDIRTYVSPGSYVLDVKVIRGNYNKSEFSSKMTEQLDYMAEMYITYCRNVFQKYEEILREKRTMYGNTDKIRTTGPCHRHVTDCAILVRHAESGKSKLSYRKLPIDQYRVEVTLANVIAPGMGAKLADKAASKGVICLILPDDHMPVDEYGNRAEVIGDPNSTISRMNNGRVYEHYIGAYSRDNWMRIRQKYEHYGPSWPQAVSEQELADIRNYLIAFYTPLNSESLGFIQTVSDDDLREFLAKCMRLKALEVFYPTDNENNIVDVIEQIEASELKPLYGKVSYVNGKGERHTTRENVRIGLMYMMMLEKIANTYSSASSAKVNNFGFPVKGTNLDKFRYPHSLTPTKISAETEKRILCSFMEPEGPADIQDLAMNPNSHKALYRAALESDKAFDTNFNIDRNHIKYSQTKGSQLLHHIFNGAGFDFEHQED